MGEHLRELNEEARTRKRIGTRERLRGWREGCIGICSRVGLPLLNFSYATESECGFMERTNLDQSDFFENKIVDLGLRVTRARRRDGVLHGGWQD